MDGAAAPVKSARTRKIPVKPTLAQLKKAADKAAEIADEIEYNLIDRELQRPMLVIYRGERLSKDDEVPSN